jgi:hypothetical protein
LQSRLDRVERTLQDGGLDIDVVGYRLGALHVRPPRDACATDFPGLEQHVVQAATPWLAVMQVVWE